MFRTGDGTTVRSLVQYQAQAHPEQVFLIYEDCDLDVRRVCTYAQFHRLSNQAANLFWSRGVRPGDRVAVQLTNSPECLEALVGLAKIGAIYVPLNSSYTTSECAYIMSFCQVRLLLTQPSLYQMPGMDGLAEDVLIVDGTPSGYNALRDGEPTELVCEHAPTSSDVVEIMFTSGTTSTPKGVMLTNANMVFSGLYVNWQLAMNSEDRYMTSMCASHVNFQLSALLPVLTAGATLIMASRYSATRFWRQTLRNDATLVQSMAMMVRTMMRQPHFEGEREHRVRQVHYFLPLSKPEKAAFEERFGVSLLNNYGSTESLVGVITDYPYGPRNWPSIGRVGPGYAARIVDAEGRELPAGECGEILIRGEAGYSLMAGYWNDPQATAKAIDADGWYHTGDYGVVDNDGWFYFADRHIDLIKRGGENISTTEVENILEEIPGVAEAAVVGVPDPVRDQAVKAVLVLEPGSNITEADVAAYAETNLASFKVPSVIEFRKALPRGAYGKLLKHLLVPNN